MKNFRRYAPGGSVQATPQNPVLGALANILRGMRGEADKRISLPVLGGAGTMLMGKTPEEIEEWSYGSSPVEMAPMGVRLPRVKPNRRESAGDALLTLGPGAPAVARGVQRGVTEARRGALGALENLRAPGDLNVGAAAGQRGAVRARGGNFNEPRLAGYLGDQLNIQTPEYEQFVGDFYREPRGNQAVQDWGATQLRNYLKRDLGAPTDPLLALEKELPGLHLPPDTLPNDVEGLYVSRQIAETGRPVPAGAYDRRMKEYLDAHDKLSGGARLTPWGRLSDSQVYGADADDYLNEIAGFRPDDNTSAMDYLRFRDPELAKKFGWLENAPEGTKVWSITEPHRDELGFGHVIDYLEAATGPSRAVEQFGDDLTSMLKDLRSGVSMDRVMESNLTPLTRNQLQEMLDFENAGLTLDPKSLSRLSVPDAVRKTAQWNEFMAAKKVEDGPLSKGWVPYKEYPDQGGMKWVEFSGDRSVPALDALPEGYQVGPSKGDPNWFVVRGPDGTKDIRDSGGVSPEDATKAWLNTYNTEQRRQTLSEGLKAEGDAMGHCVGGYCDDVAERGTKIYSLRDAKGQPHVTVEVRGGAPATSEEMYEVDDIIGLNSPYEQEAMARFDARGLDEPVAIDYLRDAAQYHPNPVMQRRALERLQKYEGSPPEIVQIKGKGNAAPADKYLPMVQDFVKSQNWSRVGDLRNTGLRRFTDAFNGNELKMIADAGIEVPYYATQAEIDAVGDKVWPGKWKADDFLRGGRRNYARGGRVEKIQIDDDAPAGFLPRDLAGWVEFAERGFQ
jgi:hypothetical protein